MAQLFANAARSTLTASITAAATTLQINPADQGLFPVATGVDWFKIAVEDSSGNIEYVKVQRAVGSPLLTVMSGGRAVEDSAKFPARSFNAGSLVELRMTAADLASSIAHPSVGVNAHAATAIAFTPVKTLASANVQAAIEELLTEGGLDVLSLQADVPQITFDTGDYLTYNRDTNLLNFVIGGAGRFYVDSSGPARESDASTSNGLVRKSQMDTSVALRCLKTANLSDLADAATALANLGGVSAAAFTGGNQSLANPGRQNLPGGLQFRFGTFTNNGQAVTFDTEFPATCFWVWMSSSAGAGIHVRLHPLNVTKSGFTVDSENVSNSSGRYIAIGW